MIKCFVCFIFCFSFHFVSAQIDSSLLIIKEVKARLDNGSDFCEMVRIYSEDVHTVKQCGEIGFFGKGELMRSYEDAMVKLKVGEISEIIKTGYGYHLIQLIEKEKKKYASRHILIKYR